MTAPSLARRLLRAGRFFIFLMAASLGPIATAPQGHLGAACSTGDEQTDPDAKPNEHDQADSSRNDETGAKAGNGEEAAGSEKETAKEPDGNEKGSKERSDKSDQETDSDKDKSKEKGKAKKASAKPVKLEREAEGFDLFPGARPDVPLSSAARPIYRTIRDALLQLKFAVAEHGNVSAFERALGLLDLAEAQIASFEEQEGADAAALASATRIVRDLRREAQDLKGFAGRTLYGRFPLIRQFGTTSEVDEDQLDVRSFAVPGDALRRAVRGALTKIAKSAASDPLHVVILVPGASPRERAESRLAQLVDDEAPYAFVDVDDARLYPGELRMKLPPMPAWDAPDPAFDPISREFLRLIHSDDEPRSVMIVMVRTFADERGDSQWVQAQQRTFELSTLEKAKDDPSDLEADKIRSREWLSHDRSRFNLWIVIGALFLFVAALVVHGMMSSMRHSGGWLNWVAVPAAAFLIGLVLTPLIVWALERVMPDPQSSALFGSWWPAVAGALALVLPAGVFRLVAGSVGRHFPAVSCHGRWGVAFVPVALGSCAVWIWPSCYGLGADALHLVTALCVAASLLVYCVGRAIDIADHFPFALMPFALVLTLLFGLGAFLAWPLILWGVAALVWLTTFVYELLTRRRAERAAEAEEGSESWSAAAARRPRTISELRAAVDRPLYQPLAEFEQLRQIISQSGLTQSTWIGLVGPSAAGKTAAARQLISELQESDKEVQVLAGACSESGTPYQPFRDALAELGLAPWLGSHSQGGEVNNIIEKLADQFIPLWDFFSSDVDDEEGDEASRADLLAAVTNALRALMQARRVVLFIDDIQWLDEGSSAILQHLREAFAPGSDAPLVIIVASRTPEAIERLEIKDSIFPLTPPSAAEQVRILENSLGIENGSAKRLVQALGVMSQSAGGMFWLMRAVRELAGHDAFAVSARGFTLRPQYLRGTQLPVPTAMRASLVECLRASGEHRPVLECAAILGEKFRIDDLAECLRMDRLELLQVLRHLEQDLQLVRDVPSDQECYAFSSTFLLEIVREELGISNLGPEPGRPRSKIAREFHARIAAVLEGRQPRTFERTCAIARHYFAAGPAYASQAVDSCQTAARAARRRGAKDDARRFLAMAEQSARMAGRSADLSDERQKIDREETSRNRQPAKGAGARRSGATKS